MKYFLKILYLLSITLNSVATLSDSYHVHQSLTIEDLDRILEKPPSCIEHAMKTIFRECIANGIHAVEPAERRALAIRMSVCEFEIAGLDYPAECCTSNMNYEACMWKLGLVPQYWTTFSGNYRDIGLYCEGVSRSNEKEQLRILYSNISASFEDFGAHLYETLLESKKIQHEAEESYLKSSEAYRKAEEAQHQFFEAIFKELEHLENEVARQQDVILQAFSQQEEYIFDYSHHVKEEVESISVNLDRILSALADEGIIERILETKVQAGQLLSLFTEEIEDLISPLIGHLEKTGVLQEQNSKMVQTISSNLNSASNEVRLFNNEIKMFGSHVLNTRTMVEQEVATLFDNIITEMEVRLSRSLENIDSRVDMHFESFLETLDTHFNQTWISILKHKQTSLFFSISSGIKIFFQMLQMSPLTYPNLIFLSMEYVKSVILKLWAELVLLPVSVLSVIQHYLLLLVWTVFLLVIVFLSFDARIGLLVFYAITVFLLILARRTD